MQRQQLAELLDDWLQPAKLNDYCPNGLQVEGATEIKRLITGVTASQALIDQAIEREADAILVHHGYFWKGEDARVIGMKQRRLSALLSNAINLFAYHLPLDVHPEFGNNVELAKLLGFAPGAALTAAGPEGILLAAESNQAWSAEAFQTKLETVLSRPVTACHHHNQPIQRIAICTGGGQGFIDDAIAAGVDAFVTGEVSEQTIHSARESGISFFAAGHHATERYGVKALGEKVAQLTGIEVQFVDIDNPA